MDRQENRDVTEVSEKLETSLSIRDEENDADDQMEKYQRLISEGKDVAKEGDIEKALELFKLAFSIHQTPKLESRIKKIQELLSQNESEDEDDEFVNVNNCGLMLYKELYDKLYSYQREGVAFLYGLYRDGRKGGILADDMGLGKTIQVISFLSGMYDSELVKHTLLVMPTSLITNWIKEFSRWTPGMRVKEFHGASKAERTRSLEKVQRRSGVVITTYNMLLNNWQQLSSYQGREFCWDYVILDEAHKIKNTSSKTAKSAYAIPSKNRVLLTGTPVQNNLREMWALFDFACQGTLLGTGKTFKTEYENPITRAREKDATPGEKALGSRMSANLMTIIKPHFLRRTKAEVQKNELCEKETLHSSAEDQPDPAAAMPQLMRKNDLIVWTYLSAVQENIYRQFISLECIKELLLTTRSPLAELNILKKLCDHPRLLSADAIARLGSEEDDAAAHSIADVPDHRLISESGKLVFLVALLERLREEGQRTLVFAHYRKVLDIIERILNNRGFKVLRLDGTITQITERERLISLFQTDRRYSVFLLTTQVGGVGITLTAANRVVIYDPSWNPATDAQAVDRAYRIGQTENVVIYRLITCGTVEEKIYRRQVFKDSLIQQNTGDKKNPFRYFSKQELKELFTLEDTRSSSTQLQLQALHSRHRQTDPQLDQHIAHLHAMDMFGISDHDLMFSVDVHGDEAPEDPEEHHYIEGRVQKAQELVRAESEVQMQMAENMAASTEPAWLRHPPPPNNLRKLRPAPPPPQVEVVDLDTSASEDRQRTSGSDLSVDPPTQGEWEVREDAAGEAMDRSLASLSAASLEQDASVLFMAADEPLHSDTGQALPNGGGSSLQRSSSEEEEASSEPESSRGNFHLQLEDSGAVEDEEMEEEEQKLLAELQMDGSFNVDRSLSESWRRTSGRHQDISMEDSVVVVRKKRAAVIHFQVLGASTPKSAPTASPPRRSRKSMGGNASVVSRRSLLQSIIQDVEDEEEDLSGLQSEQRDVDELQTDMNGESVNMEEEEEADGFEESEGGASLNLEMKEDLSEDESEWSSTELQKEEELPAGLQKEEELLPAGLQKEEELLPAGLQKEEELLPAGLQKEEELPAGLQKEEELLPAGLQKEAELPAGLQKEEELPAGLQKEEELPAGLQKEEELLPAEDVESYELLVMKGKESYQQAKLDEALSFFLRAIDIRAGDPEVQFLTIQLYRQLSQRS
ncbi:DNA excision repair protein ERCC-6-like isoform X2 [Oryzias melastigma]|uniref:DNA excision repair protein ERCC-6-like isoform X2 n=1 Tax=Oryzias melastigma TaxID=30732 RepID=UPI00168CFD17|nr:DNA excision repair protein ERCC-6-like isoform X2 [Oryzias melastigma]